MSSYVGAVNIVIGASSLPLQKELDKVNALMNGAVYDTNKKLANTYRQMDAINRDMLKGAGRLGKDLTAVGMEGFYKLTVPLGLLAYNAGQSYAELEKLEKAIESVDGGAAMAAISMKEFVQLAKMPGLGIQEVNDFYLKMKSVRVESETAFRYIKAFGGEVARGGGGKVEFGRVGRQVSQMLGKQKITQQDLNAITDSAPSFGKVVMDTFGSNTSEALMDKLAADGKTVTDFVNEIVLAMEKLDPVASGFNNALENTSDGWFLFSAELGRAVDVSVDATGKLDSLGNMLSGAAVGLKDADLATKQLVVGFMGIVGVTPVLILGLGAITTFIATPFTAAWRAGTAAMATARTTMMSFVAANPFVLIASGIVATTYAIYSMEKALDQTIDRQEILEDLAMRTETALSAEEKKLNDLVTAALSHNATQIERERAIDRIRQLHPKMLGDMTAEELATDKGTAALRRYISAMADKIRLSELDKDIAAIPTAEATQKKELGIIDTGMAMLIQSLSLTPVSGEQQMKNAEVSRNLKRLNELTDQRAALIKKIEKQGNLDFTINGNPLGDGDPRKTPKTPKGGDAALKTAQREAEKRVELHEKMLEEISKLTAENIMDERLQKQELAEQSFLADIAAKQKEYKDAKMPLDEAYFTWVAARAEKNRQEILAADMNAFQSITLKKMEAIKTGDMQSNKDAANGALPMAFSSMPGDFKFITKETNLLEKGWTGLADAFDLSTYQMQDRMGEFAASMALNVGSIVGQMREGTASIQDLGFAMLDTLAQVMRQLAMLQLIKGFTELFSSGFTKGWGKVGAGFALSIGSGIASGAATKQREEAKELYKQGKNERIAPLKVDTKLLGQNLVVSSERTIRNNSNN